MKALGATYGALALLAVVLACADPWVRVAGAQCFSAWSLLQVASSLSPAFLSPADASRRLAFHCALIAVNTLGSVSSVLREW